MLCPAVVGPVPFFRIWISVRLAVLLRFSIPHFCSIACQLEAAMHRSVAHASQEKKGDPSHFRLRGQRNALRGTCLILARRFLWRGWVWQGLARPGSLALWHGRHPGRPSHQVRRVAPCRARGPAVAAQVVGAVSSGCGCARWSIEGGDFFLRSRRVGVAASRIAPYLRSPCSKEVVCRLQKHPCDMCCCVCLALSRSRAVRVLACVCGSASKRGLASALVVARFVSLSVVAIVRRCMRWAIPRISTIEEPAPSLLFSIFSMRDRSALGKQRLSLRVVKRVGEDGLRFDDPSPRALL